MRRALGTYAYTFGIMLLWLAGTIGAHAQELHFGIFGGPERVYALKQNTGNLLHYNPHSNFMFGALARIEIDSLNLLQLKAGYVNRCYYFLQDGQRSNPNSIYQNEDAFHFSLDYAHNFYTRKRIWKVLAGLYYENRSYAFDMPYGYVYDDDRYMISDRLGRKWEAPGTCQIYGAEAGIGYQSRAFKFLELQLIFSQDFQPHPFILQKIMPPVPMAAKATPTAWSGKMSSLRLDLIMHLSELFR